MKLNESRWIYPAGLTAEWRKVAAHRSRHVLERVREIAEAFPKIAPAARRRRYLEGFRFMLKRDGTARDSLARHPAFDYWLALWDKHFTMPFSKSDWDLQMSFFQGFAASLALTSGGRRADFDAVLDPDGRLCLYGSPYYVESPPEWAQKPVRLEIRDDRLGIVGPDGSRVELTLEQLDALPAEGAQIGAMRVGRSPEAAPGLVVEDRAWLLMHGVSMHGLAHLDASAKARFVSVLRQTLSDMSREDPALLAEMTDMLRILVPLDNPMKFASVSSSYVNMRGAICLSHAENPLLQAETLIHEFCHQKLNQLMIVEPILRAGQSGQVFYSPWRKDARRLRGLLLGAHAFLNVSRYLLKSVSRDSFRRERNLDAMVNAASRLFQVESALRTLSFYASFTEFGERFHAGLWRELGVLFHGIQWFPPALIKEARDNALKHRAEHSLSDTGFHKSAEFVDKVARAPFLTPGGTQG